MHEISRNPDTNPQLFSDKAVEFCEGMLKPFFQNPTDAAAFIRDTDMIADSMIDILKDKELPFTEGSVLIFGSALGEAIIVLFSLAAKWTYSLVQDRWVVSLRLEDGSELEWNVFHKVEKRFKNGMEDSLEYWIRGVIDMITKKDG
jgi:hypothetical protein